MKYLFSVIALFLLAAAPAHARSVESVESQALGVLFSHCLEPLRQDMLPAKFATESKLPELPKEQAEVLAKKEGRVFVVRPGSTFLAAPIAGMCSVMIGKVNFEVFKKEIEYWFADDSPFKIISQRVEGEAVTREYEASINDQSYYVVVSANSKHEEGRMQAVLTIGKMDMKPRKPIKDSD